MFSSFDWGAVLIIVSVAFLDGILSVDNAMAIAGISQGLPEKQRPGAIRLGIVVAMVLRVLALSVAGLIASVPAIKLVGAAYLAYLTYKHFASGDDGDQAGEAKHKYLAVIFAIGATDLAFSIDNIVATIGLSSILWVVITGVLFSMLVMMFATEMMERLMRRYPSLGHTAFVIIGFIAASIFIEGAWQFGWPAWKVVGLPAFHPLTWLPHFPIGSGLKFGIIASMVVFTIGYEEVRRANTKRNTARVAG